MLNRWLDLVAVGAAVVRRTADLSDDELAAIAARAKLTIEPVITELKGKGLSLAKIAGELNKRRVPTPRGGNWDHSSVGNVLQRLAA